MSRTFSGSGHRSRQAHAAAKGPHYAAESIGSNIKKEFFPGDRVRVVGAKQVSTIKSKTNWDHYELKEQPGYFPPGRLELVERPS